MLTDLASDNLFIIFINSKKMEEILQSGNTKIFLNVIM